MISMASPEVVPSRNKLLGPIELYDFGTDRCPTVLILQTVRLA
jgi:hypothetical protein